MFTDFFISLLNRSFVAGITIMVVLAARLALRRAPKRFSYLLWAIPLFRLLCPFSFESVVSLLPANPEPVTRELLYSPAPQINTGIPAFNSVINPLMSAATPEAAASVNPLQIYFAVAQVVWLAGVAVLAVYSVVSLWRLNRRCVGAVRLEANIYLADGIDSPFVAGVFRPKIYLPSALSEEERAYILLHEQTHIRRGDPFIKLLSFFTLCLHWFNPLVWVAFFLSGKDMEMSCDESVMKHTGADIRKEYAASLLSLSTGRRIVAGGPLAFGEGDPKGRIKNILRFKKPALWAVVAGIVVVAAVCVCLVSNPLSPSPINRGQTILLEGDGSEIPGFRMELVGYVFEEDQKSFTVTLKNETGTERAYEEAFGIYKRVGGEWVSCETQGHMFTLLGYLIPAGGSATHTYTFTEGYDFSDVQAEYRFLKTLGGSPEGAFWIDFRLDQNGARLQEAVLKANFPEREEGPSMADAAAFHTLYTQKEGINTAYYGIAMYGRYSPASQPAGLPQLEAGGVLPAVITLDVSGRCVGYWQPRDGAAFAGDVKEKFTQEYWQRAIDPSWARQALEQECLRQAAGRLTAR